MLSPMRGTLLTVLPFSHPAKEQSLDVAIQPSIDVAIQPITNTGSLFPV